MNSILNTCAKVSSISTLVKAFFSIFSVNTVNAIIVIHKIIAEKGMGADGTCRWDELW